MPIASHGNKAALLFDVDPPIASDRMSESVRALAEAIDGSPNGRKGVAIDAAIPESTLSKILSGVQGVPGALLDALGDATILDFMQRLGRPRGIEVRLIKSSEINEQLLEAAQEMVRVIKIASTRGQVRR